MGNVYHNIINTWKLLYIEQSVSTDITTKPGKLTVVEPIKINLDDVFGAPNNSMMARLVIHHV